MDTFFNTKNKKLWQKIKRNGHFKKQKRLLLKKHNKSTQSSEIINDGNCVTGEAAKQNISLDLLTQCENESIVSQKFNLNNVFSSDPSNTFNSIKFKNALAKWANMERIKLKSLTKLMRLIKKFNPNCKLPSDARSLLKTPRSVKISSMEKGQYWHYGLKKALKNVLLQVPRNEISFSINIDGVPLFRSSNKSFWPILIKITEIPNIPPLIVGIFCGSSKFIYKLLYSLLYLILNFFLVKPKNVNSFLEQFVS